MKLKHPINLHKGMTGLVVAAMMAYFQNFSVGAWVYLALHGSYGLMWVLKGEVFPDRQWEQRSSMAYGVFVFFILGLYWIAPFLLISRFAEPPHFVIALSIAFNLVGFVLHFGSDAQKYFTLKYRPGLITDGFFARTRNTNYLGELMIYVGFAMLSMHWVGYIGIVAFFVGAFIPNMIKKDKSLSRYAEFAEYKKKSWLFLPKWF
jgi:protein-S-isoprenylcysteine O-methyltransferase Ste14